MLEIKLLQGLHVANFCWNFRQFVVGCLQDSNSYEQNDTRVCLIVCLLICFDDLSVKGTWLTSTSIHIFVCEFKGWDH